MGSLSAWEAPPVWVAKTGSRWQHIQAGCHHNGSQSSNRGTTIPRGQRQVGVRPRQYFCPLPAHTWPWNINTLLSGFPSPWAQSLVLGWSLSTCCYTWVQPLPSVDPWPHGGPTWHLYPLLCSHSLLSGLWSIIRLKGFPKSFPSPPARPPWLRLFGWLPCRGLAHPLTLGSISLMPRTQTSFQDRSSSFSKEMRLCSYLAMKVSP